VKITTEKTLKCMYVADGVEGLFRKHRLRSDDQLFTLVYAVSEVIKKSADDVMMRDSLAHSIGRMIVDVTMEDVGGSIIQRGVG
jgi:hypothetical protein